MSNYIYTTDGELYNADELYHYGVPGMKWGQRKQQRLERKLARNKRIQNKEDTKLLNTRVKNRTKIEARFDKKIERAKSKNNGKDVDYAKRKNEALKDFDAGTKGIKKAQKIKNENYNKILELKSKSISDPSIKKSKAYKQAKQWARSQRLSDSLYGKSYTLLMETSYGLANKGQSWTRGYDK